MHLFIKSPISVSNDKVFLQFNQFCESSTLTGLFHSHFYLDLLVLESYSIQNHTIFEQRYRHYTYL